MFEIILLSYQTQDNTNEVGDNSTKIGSNFGYIINWSFVQKPFLFEFVVDIAPHIEVQKHF